MRQDQRGFTMVELIVAMMIASVLVVLVTRFFGSQNRTYQGQISLAEQRGGLRASLDLVQRELRTAGYDPTGMGFNGIAFDTTKLVIKADHNGDGDLGDADELIEYSFDSQHNTLYRTAYPQGCSTTTTVTKQEVIDDIVLFEWEYLDDNDNPVTSPVAEDDIRKVGVSVEARNNTVNGAVASRDGNQKSLLNVTVSPRNMGIADMTLAMVDTTGDDDESPDIPIDTGDGSGDETAGGTLPEGSAGPDEGNGAGSGATDPNGEIGGGGDDPIPDPEPEPDPKPYIDPNACCPCGAMKNKNKCKLYKDCCGK